MWSMSYIHDPNQDLSPISPCHHHHCHHHHHHNISTRLRGLPKEKAASIIAEAGRCVFEVCVRIVAVLEGCPGVTAVKKGTPG